MATKKPDGQPSTIRLFVRTVAAHGEMTRYRAGLGPFGREPVLVEVTQEQAEALKADPLLHIEQD